MQKLLSICSNNSFQGLPNLSTVLNFFLRQLTLKKTSGDPMTTEGWEEWCKQWQYFREVVNGNLGWSCHNSYHTCRNRKLLCNWLPEIDRCNPAPSWKECLPSELEMHCSSLSLFSLSTSSSSKWRNGHLQCTHEHTAKKLLDMARVTVPLVEEAFLSVFSVQTNVIIYDIWHSHSSR